MSTSKAEKTAEKAGYHHGTLRAALVEAGLAILAEVGDPAALSLREAARRAGVSAMAPYRHFPDKGALLGAVAGVGFERLAERLRAADTGAAGAVALVEQGRAYVAFAVAEPALFRLMFGAALAKGCRGRSAEGDAAFHVLLSRVGALVPEAERDLAALHSWAIVHGLACLALDGQIESEPAALDAAVVGVLNLASRALPRGAAVQKAIDAPSQA